MSGKYLAARDSLGRGDLSLTRDQILAQLVSATYRFREDHTAEDLTGVVGEPIEVDGKEVVEGWFRAQTLKFEQVRGAEVVAIVFIRAADSTLIEYHDAIENFPLHPNGGDIEVEILEPGIFRI